MTDSMSRTLKALPTRYRNAGNLFPGIQVANSTGTGWHTVDRVTRLGRGMVRIDYLDGGGRETSTDDRLWTRRPSQKAVSA